MNTTSKILQQLKDLSEEDFKAFNHKIIPTQQQTLGVRIPILRKLAQEITKENAIEFIQLDKQNIYEMVMLEGMVLSYMNRSFQELLPLTEQFLQKVDNWAQIDSTICNFKSIKKEKKDVLKIVKKWLNSKDEFVVRTAIVILLNFYIQKENLNLIFKLSQNTKHTGYYVYMGNSWLISVCMAKFPIETIEFFKKNTLDKKTHNKAIQKSKESFRVSKEHKLLINKLKR